MYVIMIFTHLRPEEEGVELLWKAAEISIVEQMYDRCVSFGYIIECHFALTVQGERFGDRSCAERGVLSLWPRLAKVLHRRS
jgi:hypothetical protein